MNELIPTLIHNITNGEYKNAQDNLKDIINQKLEDRFSKFYQEVQKTHEPHTK